MNMWTRAELKERAKAALKPYYWWGVLVCFITLLLTGGFSSGASFNSSGSGSLSESGSGSGNFGPGLLFVALAMGVVAIFFLILAIAFGLFVSNVITVGKNKFFLESRYRGESAGVGSMFFGFSGGRYLNIVKVMFFRGLFEFLWTLLLVIPGIIKHYEYYMVPYLLTEDPSMDSAEAFRLSKEMMTGNKFATFVLELSFLGWFLLGILCCGVGILFVYPYYEATLIELYFKLKENIFGAPKVDTVFVD